MIMSKLSILLFILSTIIILLELLIVISKVYFWSPNCTKTINNNTKTNTKKQMSLKRP